MGYLNQIEVSGQGRLSEFFFFFGKVSEDFLEPIVQEEAKGKPSFFFYSLKGSSSSKLGEIPLATLHQFLHLSVLSMIWLMPNKVGPIDCPRTLQSLSPAAMGCLYHHPTTSVSAPVCTVSTKAPAKLPSSCPHLVVFGLQTHEAEYILLWLHPQLRKARTCGRLQRDEECHSATGPGVVRWGWRGCYTHLPTYLWLCLRKLVFECDAWIDHAWRIVRGGIHEPIFVPSGSECKCEQCDCLYIDDKLCKVSKSSVKARKQKVLSIIANLAAVFAPITQVRFRYSVNL